MILDGELFQIKIPNIPHFIGKTTFHVLCSCGWKQMFRFAKP